MNKYGIEKGMKGNEWLDRWIDEWIQVKERKLMDCGSEEKKEDVVRRGLVADSHSLAYLGQVSLLLGASLPSPVQGSPSCFSHSTAMDPLR